MKIKKAVRRTCQSLRTSRQVAQTPDFLERRVFIRTLGKGDQTLKEAQDLELADLVSGLPCDLGQINLTFLGLRFPICKMDLILTFLPQVR